MSRVLLLLGLLTACADDGLTPAATDDPVDTDGILEPSFAEHIEPMLFQCTGCHRGEAPDGSFDMSGDDLYGALVDQPSGQAPLDLVEPGDAEYSYLWHKINGTQSLAGGAGTRMPMGDRWSDEDIEKLAIWIDLGAAP